MNSVSLKIHGMHCNGCAERVRRRGGGRVTGDPAAQKVTVSYRTGMAEPDGIHEAMIVSGLKVGQGVSGAAP